jgi:hypothetical protein
MLYKLENNNYPRVRTLFNNLEETQPMCTAVLEGIYPGSVYVDDLREPRIAYL